MSDHSSKLHAACRTPQTQNRPLRIAFITDVPRLDALARQALQPCGHDLDVVAPTRINDLSRYASVVFVDLGAGDGVLRLAAKKIPRAIAVGRFGTAEETVAAMRAGARDYITPDVTVDALREALDRIDDLVPPAIVRARLEYSHDGYEHRTRSLIRGTTLTLGRDPRNDIVFESPFVSRFHARIDFHFGRVEIADRGSHNGVFVSGVKVEGSQTLADGDVIRLGMPNTPELMVRIEYMSPGEGGAETGGAGLVSDEAGRELKSLAQLLDTFLQLNTDLLLEDVLALVIDRSIEFAGAERGMILLLDRGHEGLHERLMSRLVIETGSQQALSLVMARNRDGSEVETEQLDMSQKLPQEVLTTGKGMIVEDLLADDRVSRHAQTIEFGVRSAMCVPLRIRRTGVEETGAAYLLGVLYVDSSLRSHPFSERLLHALESLASEAARAIQGARLYRVSLEKRRIDEEMRLAREIQEGLLPSQTYTNEWVELCGTSVPSREVGGDVLDYFPNESRIGLLVGDVSGKGVPAAIFSSMLGGHFHALTELLGPERDLGDIAQRLNQHLVSRSRLGKFVTLVFAVLAENGEFTYVNAGHNPPLMVTDAGAVRRLTPGGTILGMLEDMRYESAQERFGPQDVLVLYSDGVPEARNPGRLFYSIERLECLVVQHRDRTAREIHDAILHDWKAFTEGAPAADDATVMVVKRR